jgi:gas vesicle protein
MSNDTQQSGMVLLAFMVGALSGAAAALLFAPASGEETREYLGQKAREGRARAKEAVDQGREIYTHQRETVASAVDRGREAFKQARTQGEQQA